MAQKIYANQSRDVRKPNKKTHAFRKNVQYSKKNNDWKVKVKPGDKITIKSENYLDVYHKKGYLLLKGANISKIDLKFPPEIYIYRKAIPKNRFTINDENVIHQKPEEISESKNDHKENLPEDFKESVKLLREETKKLLEIKDDDESSVQIQNADENAEGYKQNLIDSNCQHIDENKSNLKECSPIEGGNTENTEQKLVCEKNENTKSDSCEEYSDQDSNESEDKEKDEKSTEISKEEIEIKSSDDSSPTLPKPSKNFNLSTLLRCFSLFLKNDHVCPDQRILNDGIEAMKEHYSEILKNNTYHIIDIIIDSHLKKYESCGYIKAFVDSIDSSEMLEKEFNDAEDSLLYLLSQEEHINIFNEYNSICQMHGNMKRLADQIKDLTNQCYSSSSKLTYKQLKIEIPSLLDDKNLHLFRCLQKNFLDHIAIPLVILTNKDDTNSFKENVLALITDENAFGMFLKLLCSYGLDIENEEIKLLLQNSNEIIHECTCFISNLKNFYQGEFRNQVENYKKFLLTLSNQ